ncbi:unnamed protein product [Schistosoma intercalatum]|nr:unnamed protein product [Schistosoma intercalatum]CAH8576244.1 unnamed protein product [Schistosoma intercalatum]
MNNNQMWITELLTSNWSSFKIYRHNRSRYPSNTKRGNKGEKGGNKANERGNKEVKREITCNDSTSTITPSTSNINQRLSDNSGSPEVNPCSPKFVNRKEMMNDLMMYLM